MYSILYVDDEPDVLDITKFFLEEGGEFHVETSTSAGKVLESERIGAFDAVITDYQMPGMNGIEFLKEIRKRNKDIPVLIFTGRGREDIVIDAINNGANFYVQKGGEPQAQYTELAHKTLQAILKYKAERTLANFHKVFSTVPVGLLLLNDNLRIEQASNTIATMVLREPSSIIGERAGAGLGCMHSLESPRGCGFSDSCPDCPLQNGVRNVISSGKSIHSKIISLTLMIGGRAVTRWLRVSAEPITIDASVYVVVAIDDVTDIMGSGHDARQECLFGSTFSATGCGICIHDIRNQDAPWSVLEVNEVTCRMLRCTSSDLVGKSLAEFIAGTQEPPLDQIKAELQTKNDVCFRTGISRMDGTILEAEISAHVLTRGERSVVLSVIRDLDSADPLGGASCQ